MLPMLMYPCSNCHTKPPGKAATFFFRWEENGRFADGWKLRLCVPCATDLMASLREHGSDVSSAIAMCPTCGTDAAERLSPLYLWVYPPKQPSKEYALTTCTSCALRWRTLVTQIGELQPDRGGVVGAAAPTLTSEWEAVPW